MPPEAADRVPNKKASAFLNHLPWADQGGNARQCHQAPTNGPPRLFPHDPLQDLYQLLE